MGFQLADFKLSFRMQFFIVFAISLMVNLNSVFNNYALDDVVVLTENKIVRKGISGIPELLNSDYFKGYNLTGAELSGARYRPVSLIVFAFEYQFFGANPFVSHLINVLLFSILVLLIFILLRKELFNRESFVPFVAVLLFAVHPIHSEVIANVKGRDEILTFIFLILSVFTFLKYKATDKINYLLLSCLMFFLSLLTKETAITYMAVFPLVLYFFKGEHIVSAVKGVWPLVLTLGLYLFVRYQFVGFSEVAITDVTNSPYILASPLQAFVTKIFVISKYLYLLILPIALTSEYGYNQIPYLNINSLEFVVSISVLISLVLISLFLFKERSVFSFGILYVLITLSVGTNLIFDFGAPMAERMLFIPSLGYCILLSYMLFLVLNNSRKILVCLLFIIPFYSYSTVWRNSEWKDNETLFLADIVKSPNSSRLNLFVSEIYIGKYQKEVSSENKSIYLDSAKYYIDRSMQILPDYSFAYLRLGLVYFYKGDYNSAADSWLHARKLDPHNPDGLKWTKQLSEWYIEEGNGQLANSNVDLARECFLTANRLDPMNEIALKKLNILK